MLFKIHAALQIGSNLQRGWGFRGAGLFGQVQGVGLKITVSLSQQTNKAFRKPENVFAH
jgi:hypothetical protein